LSKKSRKRFILVLILLFITASVITWWFKSNSGTGRYRENTINLLVCKSYLMLIGKPEILKEC
jgi:hypothetical protein